MTHEGLRNGRVYREIRDKPVFQRGLPPPPPDLLLASTKVLGTHNQIRLQTTPIQGVELAR